MKNRLHYLSQPMIALAMVAGLIGSAAGETKVPAASAQAVPPAATAPAIPAPFRFKLGDFDCAVLYDTQGDYSPASFFVNAPPEELARVLRNRGDTGGKIFTPYASLLVRTPTHTVLIDTGAGPIDGPANSHLLGSLAAAGVSPEQIDTVFLSHAHLDHIGGTLRSDGQPAFPRARFVMFRQEWDFWIQESPDLSAVAVPEGVRKMFVEVAHRQLKPLRDRMALIDRDTEVLPGFTALLAAGHTPGHMVVRIESAGQQLLYVADLVLSPIALEHPEWHTRYEGDIALSQATKHRFLQLAADEHLLVYAMHFPWPGLGQVVAQGDHWGWKPLEAAR